jgi:imidazolonepropionase-like amidohydrolase
MSVIADGPDEMRKVVREQLRQGATQIKLFVSGGVLSPSDPIWMNQFAEEEIRVACEEAATRRAYVMAHAHTNEATIRCLRNGVRSIEHATMLQADGAQAIVDHAAFAVPTLVIIDAIRQAGPKLGLPPVKLAKVEEVGDMAVASLDLLRSAGAKIGFGTDLLGGLMGQQSREFSLRRQVCTPLEILRQATSTNAELVQRPGELGVIAEGALADILVVDGDPLADIAVLEDPGRLMLILRGGEVMKNALG